MEALLQLLVGWWWWGKDGQGETAEAADRVLVPLLILVGVGCILALLVYAFFFSR